MEIAVPAPVAGRVRDVFVDPQRAGRRRRAAVPHRAGRRRGRRTRRSAPGSTLDAGRGDARPSPRRERCGASRRSCSASTSTPATARRLLAEACRDRDGGAARAGDPRRLRRPRRRRARAPRRRRRRRRARRRASTSTPTCARSTSSARACPTWFGDAPAAGRRPLRRDRPRPGAGARGRRCCGSSSPSSAATSSCRSSPPCSTSSRDGAPATTTSGPARDARPADRAPPAGATRRSPAWPATVRHRRFDRPHVDRARAEVVGRRCARSPPASPVPDVDREPARRARRLPAAAAADPRRGRPAGRRRRRRAPLLEVLTRRYYKIRELGAVDASAPTASCAPTYVPPRADASTSLAVRARARRRCAEALGDGRGRGRRRRRRAGHGRRRPLPRRCPPAAPATPTRSSAELAAALAGRRPARRRCGGSRWSPRTPTPARDVLTFRRPDDDGVRPFWMAAEADGRRRDDPARFEEDVTFRGLHPMIARRLQMWRLANFEITRLPAAGDVHLFDCVGRDNPSDERLVAVAEVRDLTPVRDEDGPGRRPARGRERARRLPRRHPPGAAPSARDLQPAGVEPGHALRLAADRPAARRAERDRPAARAAHRGPRPRAGRRSAAGSPRPAATSRSRP